MPIALLVEGRARRVHDRDVGVIDRRACRPSVPSQSNRIAFIAVDATRPPDGRLPPCLSQTNTPASSASGRRGPEGVTLVIRVFDESTTPPRRQPRPSGDRLGQIVKSLVFVTAGDDGTLQPILCLVSGPNRVDLARLAAVTGAADVRRATAREANRLTGFTISGIRRSATRPIRVIMDPRPRPLPDRVGRCRTPTAVFPVPPGTLGPSPTRPSRR